jgi:nitrite reductase (NADH) large subunit
LCRTLALCEHDFYGANGVHLHLGEAVLEIDRERCEVVTAEGRYGYDQLVLATGSYPFVPPIEGCSGNARLVYRTLDDLDGIRAAANARRGVVVGGGLLGLEAANALKSLGLEAHVVSSLRADAGATGRRGWRGAQGTDRSAGRGRAPVPRHPVDQRR